MLKKIFKITGFTLLAFISFVLLYALAAVSLANITVDREAASRDEVAIYIKTNGVHTDIVVPAHNEFMDWSTEVKYDNTSVPDTAYPYLALGWGDKGFYLQTPNWSDLKLSVAFNAAFGRSTTAIHATYYRNMVEGKDCRRILISREQYARLIAFVATSFQKDANGHFINIPTKANYGISDAFYEAVGSYSLLYTCNTWANSVLKHSGQKCCLWTVLDKGIFAKYETSPGLSKPACR